MKDNILLTRTGAIATITINRPRQLNALDLESAVSLRSILDQVTKPGETRALLINANGGFFSAGGDIRYFESAMVEDAGTRKSRFEQLIDAVHTSIQLIAESPVPVIAAVRGGACGFSLNLLAACSVVVASRNSMFNTAYMNLGVTHDGGGTWFLPRMIGLRKAMELFLLAENFSAEQACALGLVSSLLDEENVEAEAFRIAEKLAQRPTAAYQKLATLLNQTFERSLHEQLALEKASFLACTETKDFQAGVNAFKNKQPAHFVGR